jgi:hypothetical protein
MLMLDHGWVCFAPKFIYSFLLRAAAEVSISTLPYFILLNYVVSLIHVLPLSDSNYVDGFIVYIRAYAITSAFVACHPN